MLVKSTTAFIYIGYLLSLAFRKQMTALSMRSFSFSFYNAICPKEYNELSAEQPYKEQIEA